jgi:hypothetical protein
MKKVKNKVIFFLLFVRIFFIVKIKHLFIDTYFLYFLLSIIFLKHIIMVIIYVFLVYKDF